MLSCHNRFIYAPNVHTGGGFVLLNDLFLSWPIGEKLTVFLDERAKNKFFIPPEVGVYWVGSGLLSRVVAEWLLFRSAKGGSKILCFHSLPPLFPCKASVMVFLQNRLLIQGIFSGRFKVKTRIRLTLLRIWAKTLRCRVTSYIVQTKTMHRDTLSWLVNSKHSKPINIIPFVTYLPIKYESINSETDCDFVYVADGVAHKNHRNLLAAWSILAEENIHPRLFLTLSERDAELLKHIDAESAKAGLLITNLGQMSHKQVIDLYARSRALIYPSLTESFGLPLIEAAQMKLPILAPELDYVRDVCVPTQTFDPLSPLSIARAVKRFLEKPEITLPLKTPSEFVFEVLINDVNN